MKKTNIDRNFDDLAPKFQRKVYGGLKGRIRLSVLNKDLTDFFLKAILPAEDNPLKILDAGSGYGPFSLNLAELGHMVTLCDISAKMLEQASMNIAEKKIKTPVKLYHCAIQDLPAGNEPYDLILCHAVLEWVHDPEDLIFHLLKHLKKDGILSLTFYNLNGMIFKNLLRTNYKKIQDEDYCGWSGSLTPTHPLDPQKVMKWLDKHNLDILCHSGMRVFHDYIFDPEHRERDPETVIEMELKLSRKMPYRDLGRYQHIIGQKTG
jgi:S-adenosylmethionine-dependent methyltransferase